MLYTKAASTSLPVESLFWESKDWSNTLDKIKPMKDMKLDMVQAFHVVRPSLPNTAIQWQSTKPSIACSGRPDRSNDTKRITSAKEYTYTADSKQFIASLFIHCLFFKVNHSIWLGRALAKSPP